MITDWIPILNPLWRKYINEIENILQEKEQQGSKIYPPKGDRLNALAYTDPKTLKAVIIGQDPYHGKGQAMGLSFSVAKNTPIPPSLRNIFTEYQDDLHLPYPATGDLTPWAKEGVLLLNSILSVEEGKPASHKDLGWQEITQEIIGKTLLLPQPIVYLVWGAFAKQTLEEAKKTYGANGRKIALLSSHPSPFSASRRSGGHPAFLGSKPFSRTNEILSENGVKPIHWELPSDIHFPAV